MRVRTLARISLWALLAIALAAFAVVMWFASGAGLRWLAREAVDASGGRLAIERVERAGLIGIRIGRLAWQDGNLGVEARDVGVVASASALFAGRVVIERAQVGDLRVVLPAQDPPAPGAASSVALPDDLRLPLPVEVRALAAARITLVRADDEAWRFHDLLLGVRHGDGEWVATLESLRTPWGTLAGDLRLGAGPPHAIGGALRYAPAAHVAEAAGIPLGAVEVALAGEAGALGVGIATRAGQAPLRAGIAVLPLAPDLPADVELRIAGLEPRALRAGMPSASLDLAVGARLTAGNGVAAEGEVTLVNATSGSWSAGRVPLDRFEARFAGGGTRWTLSGIVASLGRAGRLEGRAGYDDGTFSAELATRRLDLKQLHPPLASTALAGTVRVEGDLEALTIRARLSERGYDLALDGRYAGGQAVIERARLDGAAGEVVLAGTVDVAAPHAFTLSGRLAKFDPSRLGDYPPARLNGRFETGGTLAPVRARVQADVRDSRFRGLPLAGTLRAELAPGRARGVDADLRLGSAQASAKGDFGRSGDTLAWRVRIPDLAVLRPQMRGSLQGSGTLGGTPAAPALKLTAQARGLVLADGVRATRVDANAELADGLDGQVRLSVSAAGIAAGAIGIDAVQAAAEGTRGSHRLRLGASTARAKLSLTAAGGLADPLAWRGTLASLEVEGAIPVRLLAPAELFASPTAVRTEPMRLAVGSGSLALGPQSWSEGGLASSGTMRAMPVAVLAAFGAVPPAVADLVLGARWDIAAGDTVDGSLSVRRERGDLVLPGDTPVAAGVEELGIDIQARGTRVEAGFVFKAARLGSASGRVATRLERRGDAWGLAGSAPISGSARASMPSLAWTRLLLGDTVLLDGSLRLDVQADGTVAAPALTGDVIGDGLRVRVPDQGVTLGGGSLRARWDGGTLRIERLAFGAGKGSLVAAGVVDVLPGPPSARVDVRAEQVELVSRPDRLLVVSGEARATWAGEHLRAEGRFVADRGVLELPPEGRPSASDDVVVVGRDAETPGPARVALDLRFDLGKDFVVRGRGVDARLAGALRLQARPGDRPTAVGTVRVAQGTYTAFGQELTIDRGTFSFSGPIDNPALDILAVRKKLAVEAGVAVGGTAQVPSVRLVSNPDVPDAEKLAWLTLGHGLDRTGRNEAAVLQAAAQALLSRDGGGGGVAARFGLDEIGVSSEAGSSERVVTLGKRLASNIYLAFDRGLTGAVSVIRIQLDLSRRWSVQARAGSENAVDLFYTLGFK